jgi:rhodanese-related sulfurtransferase
MMKYIALLALATGLTFSSCGGTSKPVSQEQQTALVKDVSPDEFKKLMDEKPGIVLDVRTPGEISQGKIPGAVEIDIMAPGFEDKVKELDKTKPIYVYCKAGGRSANASEKLVNFGYKDVYNMMGGYDSWNAKGYPTEK